MNAALRLRLAGRSGRESRALRLHDVLRVGRRLLAGLEDSEAIEQRAREHEPAAEHRCAALAGAARACDRRARGGARERGLRQHPGLALVVRLTELAEPALEHLHGHDLADRTEHGHPHRGPFSPAGARSIPSAPADAAAPLANTNGSMS